MQTNNTAIVNEIRGNDLSFKVLHVDGSESVVKVGKKGKYLIPYLIRATIASGSWVGIDYQGLRINEEATLAESAVNVIVGNEIGESKILGERIRIIV